MGGPGSGRPIAGRFFARLNTDFQSIDVNWFLRQGCFNQSYSTINWSRGDHKTGSIGMYTQYAGDEVTGFELSYTSNGESLKYIVPVIWTPCHYGGQRPWFLCPNRNCGRRVTKLYGGKYFLCRKCQGFWYDSQYDPAGASACKTHELEQRMYKKGVHASTRAKLRKQLTRHWGRVGAYITLLQERTQRLIVRDRRK